MDMAATWENNDYVIKNWSIQRGIDALVLNFVIYLCIAIGVELLFNIKMIMSTCFYRKATFVNNNEGVL